MKSTVSERILQIERNRKKIPKRVFSPKDMPTDEEIKRNQLRDKRARELGIKIDITTCDGEKEDIDRLKAYMYIMEDQEVPEELRKKILEKQQKQKKDSHKKDKE